MNPLQNEPVAPKCDGGPKAMLYPQSIHTTRVSAKPVKHIIMVLTIHFFRTRPPYSTARPGRLMSPTSVADDELPGVVGWIEPTGIGNVGGRKQHIHSFWSERATLTSSCSLQCGQ